MERTNSVSEYIEKKKVWKDALILLREIIINTSVQEEIKWGAPAYTHQGENIIGLAAFKEYVGIWFHQGVFLKDKAKVLFNANESSTRGLRQWRFKSVEDIQNNAGLIETYVLEAIENQKAGKKIKIQRNKALVIPEELKRAFLEDKKIESAFNLFSKAKQIEFADYISAAKQDKTKQTRLKKIMPMILSGEGLNDKYRTNRNQ